MIDDYFQALLTTISTSPIVHSSSVTLDKRTSFVGLVRGDLGFLDGSTLHFREFVNTQSGVERFMYVYHYQRADQSVVFRYDNTAHYPNLPNTPHHKHAADEANVVSATPPDLDAILKEIESIVPPR